MHGWSPLVVTPGTNRDSPTVLLDLRALCSMQMVPSAPAAVRAGAGTTVNALADFLAARGLGLAAITSTGEPTIAGALAVGAHGAVIPADGESLAPGHTHGSLANLVLELTAVVWDGAAGRYVLRTFSRAEPEAGALLVHLGRACITDVTLRAGPEVHLRCQSFVDIPVSELFAPPGSPGRTFDGFLHASGRVEAIWFPFTDKPWLKVWTPSPSKPAASRAVSGPYNYPFSDRIPLPVARLADLLVRGFEASAPAFGDLQYEVVRAGLPATDSGDIWGSAKDVQLYIRASTLRVDELGYAVLCRRADVQRVLTLLTGRWAQMLDTRRARGEFPINGPLEVRCCGLDRPEDAAVAGARAPSLAASAPRPDRPDWDTAVWINVLTLPDTRGSLGFYAEYERWLLRTFDGSWATLRAEWSKGWAFTSTARQADPALLDDVLPGLVSAGRPPDESWDAVHARLSALDPHRVLGNSFLERWR